MQEILRMLLDISVYGTFIFLHALKLIKKNHENNMFLYEEVASLFHVQEMDKVYPYEFRIVSISHDKTWKKKMVNFLNCVR